MVDGQKINIFFDNGCGGLIIKKSIAEKLVELGRARQTVKKQSDITGVGDIKTVCVDGEYTFCLPLHNGENVTLSGLALPKITSDFPMYDLSEVERDIREKCFSAGGNELVERLPQLPKHVGGDTDILLGSRYLKYFPDEVKKFETGLRIYESVFKGPDGSRGILGGPHPGFAQFEALPTKFAYYLAPTVDLINRWNNERDLPLLGEKVRPTMNDVDEPICCDHSEVGLVDDSIASYCANNDTCVSKGKPPNAELFDKIESSGTEISFRCVDCRGCPTCKKGPRFDAISIQEEVEQSLIEKCVTVDIEHKMTLAKLPFLVDPETHVVPNEHVALRVFQSQLRKLQGNSDDRKSVLDFEQKLQDMGCVAYISDLSAAEQELVLNAPVTNFLPWRLAWSESISTPCRMVFDASMSARNGCSLNSLLAKGGKSLNNLIGIILRWTMHQSAFHTDVQKMYNKVLLDPSHWKYQLYLFSEDLNVGDTPRWKVIKTLIYGVRPSGALAECGLRRTVELVKNEYPLAYVPITHDTYMDDCTSGSPTTEETLRVTDQVENAVNQGGFALKGCTISGSDPPEHLSTDGESVTVFGMKWFPKGDFIRLNISELNFSRKLRGRKSSVKAGQIPDVLTLKNCVSRTSEVFDPLGRVTPLTAGLKLDVSVLHRQCVGWDDPIPSELKSIWAANFDLVDEIGRLEFQRAVVPSDAVNLEIETIDTADAGEHLVCSAIYARFLRRDGSYSCQLIFARSKVVHDITIPRAELVAAVLNASTGHVVRTSLKEYHKHSWHISDSQVVLHWLNSLKASLKMFVRNRVVEVARLTDLLNWFHTDTKNMIADLGT